MIQASLVNASVRLRTACFGLAAAAALSAGLAGAAQAAGSLAFETPGLQATQTLSISLPGVADGGVLPANYTTDGRNLSPPISWTAGPAGTRSYVVVMEDPDASGPAPYLHWVVYAIPAGVTALPRGMHNLAEPTHPLGVAQGRNDHGSFGYSGPHVAPGEPAHHYHFEVFALDRAPRIRPGAPLKDLIRAMAGHVLARGELVASYAPAAPSNSRQREAAAPSAPGL